jgi:integrase
METRKVLISDATVKRLPLAKDPRGYTVIDRQLPGFRVKVGLTTKTFRLQLDVPDPDSGNKRKRRTLSFSLGRWPSTKADEARRKAKTILDRRNRDEPLTGSTGAVTLLEAWESYEALLRKKKSSALTIEDYQSKVNRYLKRWHAMPLRDIKRADVIKLHNEITKAGHPYMANGVMRVGHAIFNHAAKDLEAPELPTLNPFRLRNLANKETPRQTGMAASDLAGWFDQVKGLSNPIMREYQMMSALTGRRRSAVASMKWEHVHVRDGRYIDFPTPKGVSSGRAKPDRIPISWPMLRVLARCRMAGRVLCEAQSRTWVFPSVRSKSGHIEEPKGKSRRRLKDGTVIVKQRIDTSPHALRHTWISLAPKIMSRVMRKSWSATSSRLTSLKIT